jgi:serine/threonine protein kinase
MTKWQGADPNDTVDTPQLKELIQNVTSLIDHFQPLRHLGSGAYGQVFLAQLKNNPAAQYAIKRVRSGAESEYCDVEREIWYLAQARGHPNLCQLHGAYNKLRSDGTCTTYIAMEAYDRSLASVLEAGERIPFALCLDQLSSGLLFLHELHIIHRDLSAGNVFVQHSADKTPQWRLVIGDFGLARQLATGRSARVRTRSASAAEARRLRRLLPIDAKCSTLTSHVTTREYRAPEIFLKSKFYNTAIDCWSLGLILYHVAAGAEAFDISRDIPSSAVFAENIWPQFNNSLSNPLSLKAPTTAAQLSASTAIGPPVHLLEGLDPLPQAVLAALLRLSPLSRLSAAALRAKFVTQ